MGYLNLKAHLLYQHEKNYSEVSLQAFISVNDHKSQL